MYDTDIGFGYGGRVKLVDYLKRKESLDLILFNSTKGERWYVFTFSIPDLEIRQGKTYGLSFDLKAEYDKFFNYGFYGFGSGAAEEDLTILTFETINVPLTFGRGLSPHLVVEAGYAPLDPLRRPARRALRRRDRRARRPRPALRPLRLLRPEVRHLRQPDPPDPGPPAHPPGRRRGQVPRQPRGVLQPPDPRPPQVRPRLRRKGRFRRSGPGPGRRRRVHPPL
jgi:hypothetical protein